MEWTRGPVIGRGSSATVYLATTAAGDQFAVKSTDLSTSVSLQKEQHILSQLNSPHIISYKGYDITHINNTPVYNLHMEYAPGGTISDTIKKHGGSLHESLIRSYTHQILLGLDHLHLNNLVHCDIKCRNLLVGENGIKIGDFGCARFGENRGGAAGIEFSGTPVKCQNILVGENGVKIGDLGCARFGENRGRAAGIEFSGTPVKCQNILVGENGVKIGDLGCARLVENRGGAAGIEFSGTPIFMAPEVVRGEEQGFAADVWALGCVVIEMATGCNPWPEVDDPISGLYRIGYSGDVPEFPGWLSPEGKDFLGVCLRRDARERYAVRELLRHPFVVKVEEFAKNSPTSVLNQDFWGCLEVLESSPATTQIVDFSGKSPVERMWQLVKDSPSCPNWVNEEDWIIVRSSHIEESLKIS